MSIHRLGDDVVNRIAAGEVIHRPSSAVKELLENSIDAGSTSISVKVLGNGVKNMTITDNGCGIAKDDMCIVCERFTTSKLKSYDDLQQISTYGFRGEALASISHVAKVSITSRKKTDECAVKAHYRDGKIIVPSGGGDGLKPYASNVGTTIVIEDLFYNLPARRRAVKNISDEYNRILSVISQYAVHRGISEEQKELNKTCADDGKKLGVGMVCKKHGSQTPSVHTSSSDSKIDNIRSIYGSAVANELLLVEGKLKNPWQEDEKGKQASIVGRFDGYISNANYNQKKATFTFFINDRLISCPTLKRSIETLYAEYLPKGSHPYVYLSLHLPPEHVDVNVHPTKREVHFLNEDEVVNAVTLAMREKMVGANTSRVFYTQQTITGAGFVDRTAAAKSQAVIDQEEEEEGESEESEENSSSKKTSKKRVPSSQIAKPKPKKPYQPNKLVRTDPQSQSLESFVYKKPTSQEEDTTLKKKTIVTTVDKFNDVVSDEARSLTSIRKLIEDFEKRKSIEMKTMLKSMVFVGWVDSCFCLVQVGTGLYLMDFVELGRELFYQESLRTFGRFRRIVLGSSVDICKALELALNRRGKVNESKSLPECKVRLKAQAYANFLAVRADMLDEYFRISIQDGKLLSLPEILPNYTPQPAALVPFLLRICEQVDWFDEAGCFETLCLELAEMYIQLPPEKVSGEDDDWKYDKTDRRYIAKSVLFPQLRKRLCPYEEHLDPKTR
eukprot:CAMPEP_0203756436 /NCGR_PEP_ID=MMETSP0098-20131031/9728_1 /ASSEMBLY_ACC=CAM_ASM_000208 /TAXON_ID=96639 /ORGANISM=" , Strain NY0313808BC1" /LENGTH=728 /DNA_ID=CAMNT_0050648329 /DNA_START=464 /DNA_END=2647 /DNA_ORIENTATION=+